MPFRKHRRTRPAPERDAVEEARPRRTLDPEKTRERTMNRAVKLLAAKPRSVAELRERLLEKDWTDEESVDAVIAKLSEYGYLNDERFAFGFASFRVRQRPIGRQRLARDLKTRKVERETADAALDLVYSETSEEELIARAIEKRTRLRGRPSTRQEMKSLYDHLLRLGFSYHLIIRKVREASTTTDEERAPEDETARPEDDDASPTEDY